MVTHLAFIALVIGVTFLLTLHEYWKFKVAQLGEGLAYSRRQFSRRVGINILVVFILFMLYFKPDSLSIRFDFIWYGVCLCVGVLLLILAIRDLHETSVVSLKERERLIAEAAKEFEAHVEDLKPIRPASRKSE